MGSNDQLARLGSWGGTNIPNAMFGHTAYGLGYGLVQVNQSSVAVGTTWTRA